ncbi:MAG TPA: exopolysaccharide biosynthesis polyprenyl glycosylphosphotransferase, partial [Acidimicrobiales bacterium]|nr:exopolysaccharide biosynthesis polyprenyl glycosylphosphotransferase [Acidimicrobiales bacterium]
TALLVVLSARTLAAGTFGHVLPLAPTLAAFALAAAVLPAVRALSLAVHARTGTQTAKVVIVGTGTIAADVANRLARTSHIELVGYVDDDPVEDQPVIGDLAALPSLCEREGIDRVVVAFSRNHPRRTAEVLRALAGRVTIDVVPRYFELTGWEAVVDDLSGLTMICLGRKPSRFGLAAKRGLDVLVAALGIVALAPLLAAVAVAVKVSSPGPVLFRQLRLGRHGRPFLILKFRTMHPATPAEARQRTGRAGTDLLFDAAKDDHRVTALGRVLRRFGIDEAPQLFNVLKGEMSLVGPRPFVPEECADLPAWARRRFEFRPGLTGMWQVCGQHDLRLDELCRLDSQYVSTWTLVADFRILARTPGRLLRGGTLQVRR